MSIIYEPKGRAREYSPLALNLYLGCTHKCKYCYAPKVLKKDKDSYFSTPVPRVDVLPTIENWIKGRISSGDSLQKQILMSFIGDVYCETSDNNETTREVLKILSANNMSVAVLTKNPKRALKDLDIFKSFNGKIMIGSTLTFDNNADSLEWESGAILPDERLGALELLHKNGIKTFASFEPVIKPEQSLALMKKGLDFLDLYKVGKLNNFQGLDKAIDWKNFLEKTVKLLRDNDKKFYIKKDLREIANDVELSEEEKNEDFYNLRGSVDPFDFSN